MIASSSSNGIFSNDDPSSFEDIMKPASRGGNHVVAGMDRFVFYKKHATTKHLIPEMNREFQKAFAAAYDAMLKMRAQHASMHQQQSATTSVYFRDMRKSAVMPLLRQFSFSDAEIVDGLCPLPDFELPNFESDVGMGERPSFAHFTEPEGLLAVRKQLHQFRIKCRSAELGKTFPDHLGSLLAYYKYLCQYFKVFILNRQFRSLPVSTVWLIVRFLGAPRYADHVSYFTGAG